MPEIDFTDAVAQLKEQGADESQIREFAKMHGVELERANALHLDPDTAKMYGGVAGGLVAAPFAAGSTATVAGAPAAPFIELAGIGLGTAAGRQIAELWNKHVAGEETARVQPGQQAGDVAMDTLEGAAGGAAGAAGGAVLERTVLPFAARAWEGIKGMLPKVFGGDAAREEVFKRGLIQAMQRDMKGSIAPGETALQGELEGTITGAPPATAVAPQNVARTATAPSLARDVGQNPGGRPDVLAALQRSGADTEGALPLVTESRALQGQWEALNKHPKTADMMKRSVDKTMRSLEEGWDRTLARAGDSRLTREQAGAAAKQAISDAGEAASSRQGALELQWRKDMGGAGTKIEAPATRTYLAQYDLPDAPPMPGDFKKLYDQVVKNDGNMDLDGLRKWRTRAIRNGSQGSIISDADAGEWDGLVGALSKDFGDASGQTGGKASSSWKMLNDNWEQWKTKSGSLRQVANSPDGLAAFKAAFQGDRNALTRMRALRDTLPEQEWRDLSAAYLKDLSTDPKTGKLAIGQWFKNWGGMDTSLKDTLVPPGDPLRRALDDMVTIGGAVKDARYLQNWSNTASATLYLDALEGGGTRAVVEAIREPKTYRGKIIGAAKDLAARQFTLTDTDKARLLMNPDFLKWAAQGARIKPTDATAMALHLDKLGAIVGAGKIGPEIEPYLAQLRERLESAGSGGKPSGKPGGKR